MPFPFPSTFLSTDLVPSLGLHGKEGPVHKGCREAVSNAEGVIVGIALGETAGNAEGVIVDGVSIGVVVDVEVGASAGAEGAIVGAALGLQCVGVATGGPS